jgi:clan AA aspartic protease
MGTFFVRGTLVHPSDPRRKRTLRFLVDTGAFFTVVPRDILSALKVRPIREETVQFADGRKARWKVGEMRLEVGGRSVMTLVLFGKKETQALLGAYSLEGLGLSVDSRHRRLVPMPVVIVASSHVEAATFFSFSRQIPIPDSRPLGAQRADKAASEPQRQLPDRV